MRMIMSVYTKERESRVVNLLSLSMLGSWQENHMFIFISSRVHVFVFVYAGQEL